MSWRGARLAALAHWWETKEREGGDPQPQLDTTAVSSQENNAAYSEQEHQAVEAPKGPGQRIMLILPESQARRFKHSEAQKGVARRQGNIADRMPTVPQAHSQPKPPKGCTKRIG